MCFKDLPVHSWFFFSCDGKFPRYKCDEHSSEGWNIRWATPCDPDREVFAGKYNKEDKIYIPMCEAHVN